VLITASGSEANNLAVLGLARQAAPRRRRVLVSAVEHPCVRGATDLLASEGFEIAVLPVTATGCIEPAEIDGRLDHDVALIAVMLANNETGALQPICRLCDRARRFGIRVHTDAVQAAGKIQVDFEELGVSSLALAAHKLGGPKGIGALVLARDVQLEPLWEGGGQQGGLRSGTPAVLLATGFGAAAKAALAGLDSAEHRAVERTIWKRSFCGCRAPSW
jgi:cysteine desulfurase